MSKAFTREDVDPPERSGRKRSASGLPPGAVNYITSRGAQTLQAELESLRASQTNPARADELEHILGSVQVVPPPDSPSETVAFGSTLTVEDSDGKIEIYTVVGVDELDFERTAISWISPTGKALLAADVGDRVTLENGRTAKIVKTEYR